MSERLIFHTLLWACSHLKGKGVEDTSHPDRGWASWRGGREEWAFLTHHCRQEASPGITPTPRAVCRGDRAENLGNLEDTEGPADACQRCRQT